MRIWKSRGKCYVLGGLQKGLPSIAFAERFSVTEYPVSIFMIWKGYFTLRQAVMGQSRVPEGILLSVFFFSLPFVCGRLTRTHLFSLTGGIMPLYPHKLIPIAHTFNSK